MINEKAYKKITRYASKFARKIEDAEDIAQTACLLLLEHPTSVVMTNKFLFLLVKRGYWHNKYKSSHNVAIVRNQDVLLADFEEQANLIPEETNLENVYCFMEYKAKLRNFNKKYLTCKESELFDRILSGTGNTTKDRTHYENLKNKLRKGLT